MVMVKYSREGCRPYPTTQTPPPCASHISSGRELAVVLFEPLQVHEERSAPRGCLWLLPAVVAGGRAVPVDDVDVTALGHHDVIQLQVAVHNAARVCVVEGRQDASQEAPGATLAGGGLVGLLFRRCKVLVYLSTCVGGVTGSLGGARRC